MRRGTNLPAVGGFNQTVILDAIRRSEGGLSRVELAELTGLSSQTISNVSRRLLDDGLIREAGKHIRGRGKPRVMLELEPTSRFAVGVHLDPAVVTFVVLDLQGNIVLDSQVRASSLREPSPVIGAMVAEIDKLLNRAGVDADRLLGVGLAAPGPIDAARGMVVNPPLMPEWHDVPLRDEIAAATGLPVLLEKDVNAAVVAELWTGGRDMSANFAFFYLGTGIGVGLALGGEVVRGAFGNAGEGGTIVVSAADAPASRRSDMLGHLATPGCLVDQAIELGVITASGDDAPAPDIDDAFDELLQSAVDGDRDAVAIMRRAGEFVGGALVTVVNLLDVDLIVFGGPYWPPTSEHLLPVIRDVLSTSPFRVTHREIELRHSSLGDDAAAVGAACLMLDSTLSPRPSTLLIDAY